MGGKKKSKMNAAEESEEERIRLKEEAALKQKVREKKIKDINKNFDRKDKK